ncbi:MAG: hypothetical protein ACRDSH_08125 [Pseudonocardiaceae bacterium]
MGFARKLREWRRYRRMSRSLSVLDRLDRKAAVPQRGSRPRSRWLRRGEVGYVLSFMAIVGLLLYLGTAFPWLTGKGSEQAATAHPPAAGTARGPYAFTATTPSGRPVTYDPCRPIHYVVNPAGMPPGGLMVIRDAIRVIGKATGLTFTEDGLTREPPHLPNQPSSWPQAADQRWPPVLIAWVSQAEYPPVSGDVAGIGGSLAVEPDGPESARYVTGQVVLDREDLSTILRLGGHDEAQAIVMHELGHLVGLAHVADPAELMAQENSGQTELGPGDRQGLAVAGAGRCWPGP